MLTSEDHLEIESLYARYNNAILEADGPAWADCFTNEATFSNRQGSHAGRAELIRYGNEFSQARNARYWINNLVIEPSAEGASGSCYLIILHVAGPPEPVRISLTGLYTDSLIKVEGHWKFASRHIARDLV